MPVWHVFQPMFLLGFTLVSVHQVEEVSDLLSIGTLVLLIVACAYPLVVWWIPHCEGIVVDGFYDDCTIVELLLKRPSMTSLVLIRRVIHAVIVCYRNTFEALDNCLGHLCKIDSTCNTLGEMNLMV